METIGQRLKRLRAAKGLSQAKLAKEAGLGSQGAIGNIEAGTRGYGESIVDIARVLETTPDYLRLQSDDLGEVVQTKPMAGLPLVGEVKGGEDGYLEELQYPVGHGEGVIEYPTSDPHAYALRVRGDSMFPRYRAGEFVIVEPSIEPQTGDDVVVLCTNGRKLLKVMNWKRDGEIQLLSINNGYAPLTLPLCEVQSIQLAAGRARRSALKKV